MPTPVKYFADFMEDGIYHVYNHTGNRKPLFKNDHNRVYFLKQYAKYLQPVLETYCWNLLPNHFHFLVQVNPLTQIIKYVSSKAVEPSTGSQPSEGWLPVAPGLSITEMKFFDDKITLSQLAEHYFRSFFQSYSLASDN